MINFTFRGTPLRIPSGGVALIGAPYLHASASAATGRRRSFTPLQGEQNERSNLRTLQTTASGNRPR